MGSIAIRDAGKWKGLTAAWARDGGVWKPADEIWYRYNGNWVKMFDASPSIGDEYQGGYYFGEWSDTADGVATHKLVIASTEDAIPAPISQPQGTYPATSLHDGVANTIALAAINNSYAVQILNSNLNGFDDWHWPARKEIEIAYYNLAPLNVGNSGFGGDNEYAVPSRAGQFYTASVPPQTSVAIFQDGGSQALSNYSRAALTETTFFAFVWTSSIFSANNFWLLFVTNFIPLFNGGYIDGSGTGGSGPGIPLIRRVPI